MTIVIVTTAIIVLISIFAVFLVIDNDSKKQNKNAETSLTQASDKEGGKDVSKSSKVDQQITVEVDINKKPSAQKKKDKKSKSKKSNKKSNSDKAKQRQNDNSYEGLPIDWFDE